MKMAGGIYAVINTTNLKFQIGRTLDFERRENAWWSVLRRGKSTNNHLQNSWNKYGENSFIFVPIVILNDDVKLQEIIEQRFLNYYSIPNPAISYNMNPSSCAMKHTEESKRKIGEWAKEYGNRPEVRERMSESQKRRWADPIIREKMMNGLMAAQKRPSEKARKSKASKEHHNRPETKIRFKEIMRELRTPEYLTNHGKKMKEHWADPEYRSKVAKSIKDTLASPEARAKKSKIMKEFFANNPETKAKMSKQMAERWKDPKYRAKMTKLTETDVRIIRMRLDWGDKQKDIANNYSVDQAIISNINTGKRHRAS